MIRLTPGTRAVVLAAGLALAITSPAAAQDSTTVVVTETEAAPAPEPAEPFMATIYFGPGFGLAQQDSGSDFGWAFYVLARPIEYLGLQVEYLNLGDAPRVSGDHDGVYFGLAPMLPVHERIDLFAQVGIVVGDPGDDVAAGAGMLYTVPIPFFERHNVDLDIRLDYKYLNWDHGDHIVTLGFMFGLHK
ncbi:MAG: hypothetical protein ABR587_07200 [Candidatus Binatia bacterium]